jgi:hypothetical protein
MKIIHAQHDRQFVLSLIKDNLRNMRLVSGLDNLGLEADHYYLQLSETILMLMGISEKDEETFNEYLRLCEKVKELNIILNPERLDQLAIEIYNMLGGIRSN